MAVNKKMSAAGAGGEKNTGEVKRFIEKVKSVTEEIIAAEPVKLSFTKLNKEHPGHEARTHYYEFEPLKKTRQAIYIIAAAGSKESVRKSFFDAKTKSGKSFMCRFNEDNFDAASSKQMCLYVGSTLSIVNRIKEHWGIVNPHCYAMHLKDWLLKDDANKITIKVLPVPDEYAQYRQAVQDMLWHYYKPVFGNQGAE